MGIAFDQLLISIRREAIKSSLHYELSPGLAPELNPTVKEVEQESHAGKK